MPLLIIPLVILAVLALWLLLLPIALWQRYRAGRARRRAWPWVVSLNTVLLPLSAALFLVGMAVTGLWWPGALAYASAGVAAGLLTGLLGLALARFEYVPQGLFYTPDAWLVLALTLLVAARVAMSAVELWRYWRGGDALALLPVLDHATLFSVAGLLIGYYMAFNWGLRRRLRRAGPAR